MAREFRNHVLIVGAGPSGLFAAAERVRCSRLYGPGMVLLRPDGHIGFRFPSTSPAALDALDRHLASYLVPNHATGERRG